VTRRSPSSHALRDETGSTLPLTVFFSALALALVLLVVAATSMYIERKRLFTLADGAALAGAEAFDLEKSAADRPQPELDGPRVLEAARDYLDGEPTGSFDGLALEDAGTADGRSATVILSCTWHPPLVSFAVPSGVRLEVTATARSVFD
jgi:hypothetical protein